MKIQIVYQTQYAYEQPVTFSQHLFRLFPKAERHVRVLHSDFQTNLDSVIHYRRDLFDNEIASCFYPQKSALLQASFNLELAVEERNAFGFLVAAHAIDFPFQYEPAELRVLSPYLGGTALELPFWRPPSTPKTTVDVLIELNDAIHDTLKYERRDEGDAFTTSELLARGSGACRDFAVLLAEVLRGHGLAARLASGYLCEFGDADKVAEGALHAWTEVYLPGAGWLGMDPTNGTFCDHHHLTAAVGLTAADISPVLGNYYNQTHVPSLMSASLQIIPHGRS
ncbi:MAG TPA: transglutaminase family protein [Chthoniobacteraceae bacterium]|jgi:transglutaminase-like putative cysteine protease